MTVSDKPPRAGRDQFENYCPVCGHKAYIAYAPNANTLRYECGAFPLLCDWEHDVPKRLPGEADERAIAKKMGPSTEKLLFIPDEQAEYEDMVKGWDDEI